jgi:hypothetical protein
MQKRQLPIPLDSSFKGLPFRLVGAIMVQLEYREITV